jgi:hypothetical protein
MSQLTLSILLLTVALIAHLAEEMKTGFRKRLPLGEMPLWLFVGLNVLIYGYCFYTLKLAAAGHPRAVILAWLFAIAMLFNGLGHIGIMVWRRKYFPGGVTASLLLVGAGYLIITLGRM